MTAFIVSRYEIKTVDEYLLYWTNKWDMPDKVLVLRYDVDISMKIAYEFSRWCKKGTFYIRRKFFKYKKEIEDIDSRHHVGYHYEDYSRYRGDILRATSSITDGIRKLNSMLGNKVFTVAPHGNPLSSYDNAELFEIHGSHFQVMDASNQFPYGGHCLYLTDIGRRWTEDLNVYNKAKGDAKIVPATVESTDHLISYVKAFRPPVVYLTIHPERWYDKSWFWYYVLCRDILANFVKRIIRFLR